MSRKQVFSTFLEGFQMYEVFYHIVIHGLGFFICFMIILRVQNNKTRFFYVLYSDKTWVFDQLESVQGSIYIVIINKDLTFFPILGCLLWPSEAVVTCIRVS